MLRAVNVLEKTACIFRQLFMWIDPRAPRPWIDEKNPEYWHLIDILYKIRKLPLVMDTSFNVVSKPIAEFSRTRSAVYNQQRLMWGELRLYYFQGSN